VGIARAFIHRLFGGAIRIKPVIHRLFHKSTGPTVIIATNDLSYTRAVSRSTHPAAGKKEVSP